jgi:hypothetical protein
VAPSGQDPQVRLRCPICQVEKEVEPDFPHRPFCSKRCKTIDLGNWLDENYRISRPLGVDEVEDDEIKLN